VAHQLKPTSAFWFEQTAFAVAAKGRFTALVFFAARAAFEKQTLPAPTARSVLSRILPVRAPRSERRDFQKQPLLSVAAKATEEPNLPNAAAYTKA